jgi:D-beta-D-heptose 7-phosphate kinase/D-beta-D-heptose 1-phosphate adenosyltransferase
VDYVVLFDEDTPISLIEAIRPDVLTKGADYSREEVVGGDLVESYGGRVERVDLVAGKSSSGIIERIAESREG